MPKWTQFRVEVEPHQSEAAAQILLDAGCAGTQIDDEQVVFDESEDASFVARERAIVTGFLEPQRDAEAAATEIENRLREGEFGAALQRENIDDSDWSTNWRENFPPLEIGRFLILPSWENAAVENENLIPLRLDPGLAFGTGQHPTTHLCLELIGEIVGAQNGLSVLDVGCGSGILSIAAAKLGAKVVASDLDPWCVRATQENARDNDVEVEVHEAAGADWTSEQFDVVVANLMSDLLIRLAPQLKARVGLQSTLIVSGISSPRADEVEAALNAVGFTTMEKRERDGDTRGDFLERWTAFVLKG